MAQFRTFADLKTEVLAKAGEPTNGNSAYDSLALTYLNKAHQAIVGGGSIFNLNVDEPWTWARNKHSIILELQPAYTTGAVIAVNGSRAITFTSPPSASLEGWYIQFQNDPTVYKLSQHTAASASATLDSSCNLESGTVTFRAFKLEYEIQPTYIIVDSNNDKIDLIESGSTEQTVTLTHGAYTPDEFIAHIVIKLNALPSAVTYSGSYDSVTRLFTITSDLAGGLVFKLLGATGTNRKRSALPSLGLDRLDYTGAGTYNSTYIIGGVSRIIEPFKVFKQKCKDPFIYSDDLVNMELDFPLWNVKEKIPTKFAKIAETNDGVITVRFNSYPAESMRVEIGWIPLPKDAQNNDASIPIIPRKDIDCLIHAASAWILCDKEDTKFKDMLDLAGKQLEAMQKKNRSEMRRTDRNFGQIIPRADMANVRPEFQYGYEFSGGGTTPETTSFPVMRKITKTYADFAAAATSFSLTGYSLPGSRGLFAVLIKHSVAFSGGSISALVIDVGITGDETRFINGFDVMQAVSTTAQESVILFYYPGADTDIIIRARSTGDNLNALTAGSVDVYLQEIGAS